jgi:hypothetical protein
LTTGSRPSDADDQRQLHRANETPLGGGVWTQGTGETFNLNLSSNTVVPSSTADDSCAFYSGATWGNDQSSQCTISEAVGRNSGGEGVGVCVRHAAAARTYYRVVANHGATNNWTIGRFLAGRSRSSCSSRRRTRTATRCA